MESFNSAGAGLRLSRILALLLGSLVVSAVSLPISAATPPPVLIVANDPGGSVTERVAMIAQLRRDGTRVEITGTYCLSACTLYLGLPGACANPDTVFGFHGPASGTYGIGLTPAAFEHWSRVMARHYPARLRGWFLDVARKRTMGFHSLRGRDLIALGVAACARG